MYKNGIIKYAFPLIILLFLSCSKKKIDNNNIQDSIPLLSAIESDECPKLYLCLGQLPEKSILFARKNKIEHATIITGNNIHNPDQLTVNTERLKAKIKRVFPNPNVRGIGVLNWEGAGIKILEKGEIDSPEFRKIINAYYEALKIVQTMRPNVKWGYYSIPLRNYWHRDQKWKKRNTALAKIYQASDILFPSVYDFYHDEVGFAGPKKDSLYVNDNVEMALLFGKKYNKEVMPFVWHRYHRSNKSKAHELIPEQEFIRHIDAALNASFDGKQISGLIWWGADHYLAVNKKNTKVSREIQESKMGLDKYQNNITLSRSTLIHNHLKSHCQD